MKLAIICSGQAGQHPQLLDALLQAPEHAGLRNIASELLGQDVSGWWQQVLDTDSLFINANAQFAIALYQLAVWAGISARLPAVQVVAGYSLGELLAWHVAGALDARTTLQLVRQRATLMDIHGGPQQGSCLAMWRGRSTPAMREQRDRAIQDLQLAIAIYRPGHEQVIGGPSAALDELLANPALQADIKRLPVYVPAHTRYCQGAVAPFRAALQGVHSQAIQFPVLAGIDGRMLRDFPTGMDCLAAQLAQPVRWDWCQETLLSLGIDKALELGPGSGLARLLEQHGDRVKARAACEFADTNSLLEWVAG